MFFSQSFFHFLRWHAKGIAEIIVEGGTIESKIYKDHGIVISKFKSGKMVDLSNKKVVVHIQGVSFL